MKFKMKLIKSLFNCNICCNGSDSAWTSSRIIWKGWGSPGPTFIFCSSVILLIVVPFGNLKLFTLTVSPLLNLIGSYTSLGLYKSSLQCINVSSKSKTTVFFSFYKYYTHVNFFFI